MDNKLILALKKAVDSPDHVVIYKGMDVIDQIKKVTKTMIRMETVVGAKLGDYVHTKPESDWWMGFNSTHSPDKAEYFIIYKKV